MEACSLVVHVILSPSVQFPIVDQFSAEQPSRIEKGIHAHVLW